MGRLRPQPLRNPLSGGVGLRGVEQCSDGTGRANGPVAGAGAFRRAIRHLPPTSTSRPTSLTASFSDGYSGSTVQVESGVTVNNDFNFTCPDAPPPGAMTIAGFAPRREAWDLTNLGTIGPPDFGTGVMFNAGGNIDNWGSISGDEVPSDRRRHRLDVTTRSVQRSPVRRTSATPVASPAR